MQNIVAAVDKDVERSEDILMLGYKLDKSKQNSVLVL